MIEKKKNYIPTAMALYFTFFIHGIGVSILAQYKESLTMAWGTGDIGSVLQVIAALGLGRLISLPVAGPLSDSYGRRITGLIGILFYSIFFIGIAKTSSMTIAYILAICGGIANSFLDTCVIPTVLEIFSEDGAIANMFTKFSMSIGQLILPFAIGYVASHQLSYTTLFYLSGILLILDGILLMFLPFPEVHDIKNIEKNSKMKFSKESLALIAIGFMCTATFQLWLNCNQELGLLYGMQEPSRIQFWYAVGTMVAIPSTGFFVLKYLSPQQVLIVYPLISIVTLGLTLVIKTPGMLLIAGLILGFTAAGGILQLVVSLANEQFPKNKGKITSIVMIASSIANYVVLGIAGKITQIHGVSSPPYIVMLNMGITTLGMLLAIYVYQVEKKLNSTEL